MKRIIWLIGSIFFVLIVGGLLLKLSTMGNPHLAGQVSPTSTSTSPTQVIQIVAAENFYGDVASQLGGSHVMVTSLLSDPNVEPHEYESNVQDNLAIAKANLVIKNGLGYDTWIDKLLVASPNQQRIVLTGGALAPQQLPDNPHVWYGIDNMITIAQSITNSLKKIDPSNSAEFDQRLVTFTQSLSPLQQKVIEISTKFSRTPVGLTETVFLYQTQPAGLMVITPINFEKAIAQGNDPSVADVKTVNNQVNQKKIKVLIYNIQTVTPITTNLQKSAQQFGIPLVPVSELLPKNHHYQSWMLSQLNALEKALQLATQKE